MYKSEVFFGNSSGTTASDKLNAWLDENPGVDIEQFVYQQARYGDHSICILYKTIDKPKDSIYQKMDELQKKVNLFESVLKDNGLESMIKI